MNIQVVSDVHLEFGGFELPDNDCDVLIAAGDIGVGTEGLDWLQTLGTPVIYVAGNHEYWGCDIKGLNEILRKQCEGSNVHFLEKESVVLDGVRFVGCTLWTNFNGNREALLMDKIENMMNDFRNIYVDSNLVSSKDLIEINESSKKWLINELGMPHEGPTVAVTHHAPIVNSWASDHNDFMRFAYCNDLEETLKENSIDLWAHGHIHRSSDYTKHGVRVVCNPRGYTGYQIVDKFNPEKIFKV